MKESNILAVVSTMKWFSINLKQINNLQKDIERLVVKSMLREDKNKIQLLSTYGPH